MCFPMCSAHLVNSRASVPAVSRCHPSFVKVRCNWSIRVASVFRSFALVCLPVFWSFARTGRSTCHLCSAVLTFVCQFFYIARCGWSNHVSSVLCNFLYFLSFTLFTVTGSSTCHLCSTGISGPTLPPRGGVLEHRCVECSLPATTCQVLRQIVTVLETRCPSVLNNARRKLEMRGPSAMPHQSNQTVLLGGDPFQVIGLILKWKSWFLHVQSKIMRTSSLTRKEFELQRARRKTHQEHIADWGQTSMSHDNMLHKLVSISNKQLKSQQQTLHWTEIGVSGERINCLYVVW